jgi:excisionase family DNA binding protein
MSDQVGTHENGHMVSHEQASVANPKPELEALTVADASALFGVSVSTIRRLLADGKLPGATKRTGPKGDEWVIPPADLTALDYTPQAPQAPQPLDITVVQPLLDSLRADLEARHESEVKGLQEKVDRANERADNERQLRESVEVQANLAKALAVQVEKRNLELERRALELETSAAKRRWFRKQTKPKQSETDPKADPQNPL